MWGVEREKLRRYRPRSALCRMANHGGVAGPDLSARAENAKDRKGQHRVMSWKILVMTTNHDANRCAGVRMMSDHSKMEQTVSRRLSRRTPMGRVAAARFLDWVTERPWPMEFGLRTRIDYRESGACGLQTALNVWSRT